MIKSGDIIGKQITEKRELECFSSLRPINPETGETDETRVSLFVYV